MSLNRNTMYDLLEMIDRTNNDQKIQVLFRLHENPPENVDAVQEALSTFDALDEVDTFKFLSEVKKRIDPELLDLMI